MKRLAVLSMYAVLTLAGLLPAQAAEAPQGKPVTVRGKIASVEGQTVKVTTKDGEQKVFVPPGTPIVKNVSADRSALKAGAGVFIPAVRGADGAVTATRVTVGIGGTVPPM